MVSSGTTIDIIHRTVYYIYGTTARWYIRDRLLPLRKTKFFALRAVTATASQPLVQTDQRNGLTTFIVLPTALHYVNHLCCNHRYNTQNRIGNYSRARITPVYMYIRIERADTPRCCYQHLKGVGEGARLRLKYTLDGEEDSGGVKILVGLYLEHQKDPGPGKCTKLEALSVLTGMRALNRNRPAL